MPEQTDTAAPCPSSVVTLRSKYNFEATVTRIKAALAERGVTLFADIDQSDAAAKSGISLRPTRLLLFGNPKAGTPVMEANPHAALELPLKAVVWEDPASGVWVDYQDVTKTLELDYKVVPNLIAPLKPMPMLLSAALA
ncbi:DUF302 domain-containing protein [Burkholderia sp. S171]|uniref:DUF302 domain-containing protein n=1 Tax=Burkholderia sp. S171 TaxID=1641860 RepID=UPI00131E974B|nr:DUF302 domain-containing protein [Burkholderia sp. S171]